MAEPNAEARPVDPELEDETPDPLEPFYNSIVLGRVLEVRDDAVVFDIGQAHRALVAREEFAEVPAQGAEFDVLVEEPGPQGLFVGSTWKANAVALYDRVKALVKQKATVDGTVVAANEGGLVVDVEGLRAFVPRSQIDLHRVEEPETYVGIRGTFAVLDFDERRGDLIVSRRKVLEARQDARGRELADKLEVGQVFDGVVRRVVQYGAFVDIGGIEGLLHVSNLTWGRLDDPSAMLQVGQHIQVQVLEYKPKRKRLSLGHKQLTPDPWADIEARFAPGAVVRGTVANLAPYGAFVELAPGVEGLVHNTELSWTENVRHPKSVVSPGDELEVKILDIDTEQQRIRLSVRALQPNPWQAYADAHPVGSRVTGKVARFADFGVFIELAPGIDGLLHVNDISWTERIEDPRTHFEVGQALELVLLSLDVEQGRASLGLKQLTADPWTEAAQLAKPGEKIEVEVVRLVPFGAFAKIIEGVEGLIHISEMREERVADPSQVVSVGKKVEALVLAFDRKKQRVSLSLKRDELPGAAGVDDTYEDEGEATTSMGDLLRGQLRGDK